MNMSIKCSVLLGYTIYVISDNQMGWQTSEEVKNISIDLERTLYMSRCSVGWSVFRDLKMQWVPVEECHITVLEATIFAGQWLYIKEIERNV
jgi:hypothetical protein